MCMCTGAYPTKPLRDRLQKIFHPIIANAEQYADLGSSQQCEHANKEVSLRAPKSHHYGGTGTKSLDYRVHASAAFINRGRMYISQVKKMFEAIFQNSSLVTVSIIFKCTPVQKLCLCSFVFKLIKYSDFNSYYYV